MRNLKYFIFTFAAIILFFLVVELFGQFGYLAINHVWFARRPAVSQTTNFNRFTIYGGSEYAPNSTVIVPSWYPRSLTVDVNGFVDNGYNKLVNKDDFNIIVLGGSTVEGRGVSGNDKTICAQLEKILQASFPEKNIRVINAGVCGAIAYQELCRLKGKVLSSFTPRMVVALDGRNDAHYGMIYARDWRPDWHPYFKQLEGDVNRAMADEYLMGFKAFLTRYSTIAAGVDKLAGMFRPKAYVDRSGATPIPAQEPSFMPAHMRRICANYFDNELLIYTACHARNIPYYHFLQPVLLDGLAVLNEREVKMQQKLSALHKHPYYWQNLNDFYNAARQEGKKFAWFYDLSDLFVNDPARVYWDDCHYNDYGSLLIARRIAAILAPAIRALD